MARYALEAGAPTSKWSWGLGLFILEVALPGKWGCYQHRILSLFLAFVVDWGCFLVLLQGPCGQLRMYL